MREFFEIVTILLFLNLGLAANISIWMALAELWRNRR